MTSSKPINPRKRPRQERAGVTFDAILEAAARILETQGLSGITTNAVAESAGVSIGSLYQYFPSKDGILAELIRRERELFKELIITASLDSAPTLGDAIHRLLTAAVAHQLLRPRLAQCLEYAESSLTLDEETDQLNEMTVTVVEGVLRTHNIRLLEPTARDLVALIKGLIDAAGKNGETDMESLLARAKCAAMGYLHFCIK